MREYKKIIISRIILVILFAVFTVIDNVQAEDVNNIVLVSPNTAPYKDIFSGFQSILNQQGIKVNYDEYVLESDAYKTKQFVQVIKNGKVNIIFTVGNKVTDMVLNEAIDTPIVASMFLKNNKLMKAKNLTGVTLEVSLETEFLWMQKVLPGARRVAVIYNPEENSEKINLAESVAKKMGLILYAQSVKNPKDLPNALKNVANNADVLWGIPDNLVLNSHTAKEVLLFSFRNSIPFCGLSPNWVEAGALYSLCWDYTDIGRQGGEAALKIMQGDKPNSVPIVPPRNVLYSLNLRTAKQMKIKISEELISKAHQVFKE